ncbi:hypothetical protein GUJ93_ZPchr0007g5607 [Zizania palustris]|uniref:Uncharacterized protein n=1 Tax=Zizania palustris TaxID=103762 RepID=A0A8J5TBI1_ZIZPA|nr:hypothetical protein GUJ93_ZPchr0007g5607 [Zizania palustris]
MVAGCGGRRRRGRSFGFDFDDDSKRQRMVTSGQELRASSFYASSIRMGYTPDWPECTHPLDFFRSGLAKLQGNTERLPQRTAGQTRSEVPKENEETAARFVLAVQWHRVCIYSDRLGSLALKHVKTGSILYLEGNLETRVFSDLITGLVRRIREISVRSNGMFITVSI